ncbi:MAG: hypothetical protein CMC14_08705 [Flavobacteriaceae bacterium]|nr:hypothetical protein [Flavobacteriaceae bacterium]
MSFIAVGVGLAVSAGGAIYGGIAQNKMRKRMEGKQRDAQRKLDRQRAIYENLDTSNPFMDLENTMEDLTVNQQQAEFERQSFQQSQANIMQGLRGAAGGSGVAALAASLSRQGQLASQRSAANIGQQERQNQMARQQQASQIQQLQAQGERQSQQMEMQKQAQLMGMDQQSVNMYAQAAIGAEQAGNQAVQQGMQQFGGQLTSMGTQLEGYKYHEGVKQ